MNANEIIGFLQEKIHSVIAATVNERNLPVTCAIDIMDYDDNGVYFLTAKGKNFYTRLKTTGYIALTGMKGDDTLSRVAVSLCGKVKEIGTERLQTLLDKNPYMYEIYPTEQSRSALTVFSVYKGDVEWFDLSKKPIERFSASFGGKVSEKDGYFVTDECKGCKKCLSVCPQNCIEFAEKAYIRQENCLRCGNCLAVCPVNAIEKK